MQNMCLTNNYKLNEFCHLLVSGRKQMERERIYKNTVVCT